MLVLLKLLYGISISSKVPYIDHLWRSESAGPSYNSFALGLPQLVRHSRRQVTDLYVTCDLPQLPSVQAEHHQRSKCYSWSWSL